MKYDPQIHHRRSIRLKGYDYSQSGAYFITICCQKRLHRFGKVVEDRASRLGAQMMLNDFGRAAVDEWLKLPGRFSNVELDVFQVMPNHMHGIIVLNSPNVGAGLAPEPGNEGFIPMLPGNIRAGLATDSGNDGVSRTEGDLSNSRAGQGQSRPLRR